MSIPIYGGQRFVKTTDLSINFEATACWLASTACQSSAGQTVHPAC